mmetsp:Transcript_105605/g.294046  ORF Transcript_105605/g.294046 Transcript_105605/m.294046 type:complete len:211 (+) Transcript_105605:378-1010(+)
MGKTSEANTVVSKHPGQRKLYVNSKPIRRKPESQRELSRIRRPVRWEAKFPSALCAEAYLSSWTLPAESRTTLSRTTLASPGSVISGDGVRGGISSGVADSARASSGAPPAVLESRSWLGGASSFGDPSTALAPEPWLGGAGSSGTSSAVLESESLRVTLYAPSAVPRLQSRHGHSPWPTERQPQPASESRNRTAVEKCFIVRPAPIWTW